MIHHPRWDYVESAIVNALWYIKPDEVILGVSPTVLAGKRGYSLDRVLRVIPDHVDVSVLAGTDVQEERAAYWFAMFDAAKHDWIVNTDDDDLVIGNMDLRRAARDPEVGLYHAAALSVFVENGHGGRTGDIQIRRSQVAITPADGRRMIGSLWAVRRVAWESISDKIERDVAGFNDFRLAWHILKQGWQDYYDHRILQVIRVKDFSKVPMYKTVMKSGGWTTAENEIRRRYKERFGS